MSQIKSIFQMDINQKLSKDLRDIVENIEDTVEKITDDEDRLKELNDGAWSIAFGNILLRILIFFMYLVIGFFVAAIINKSWWVNLIGAFIGVLLVEVFFFGQILKINANKRLKTYTKDLKLLEKNLNDLIDEKLLPEINSLGMMTAQNIINKTSARYLPIEYIEGFMNEEVERGRFEKIKLNNDILYKSKNPKFINNIKTVVLEID
jgi:ABC-type multidrug transport system fused ATPase/permease subunit